MVEVVKINFPVDKNELISKAEGTIAKILVNKLKQSEIEELIKILQKYII